MTEPTALVEVRGLKKYFPVRTGVLRRARGWVHAVEDVNLDIYPEETLGLVGESGSGKSTLGRLILRLEEPTRGSVRFMGKDLSRLGSQELKKARRDMQIVFQDPMGSLNPRLSVGSIVSEGLRAHRIGDRAERSQRVDDILARVGLSADAINRLPHTFSGGQRQRIGIARALVLRPRFIVADEPVSALDVSIQSQVLNLLVDLRREFHLTFLFIAHNLAVVSYIADRIAVMYLGRIVELATTDQLLNQPLHPYTVALLSAIPEPNPDIRRQRIILRGEIPSPMSPPSGCPFRTRCPIARDICSVVVPSLEERASGHHAACHFPGEMSTLARSATG